MKDKTIKNMVFAFLLNFIFSIIEIIGGIITNSIAITTDAIHDLGDSLSIAITIFLQKLSKKKPNENYTYGYVRYSIVGAMINLIILLVGSVIVIYTAIPRLLNPSLINHDGMLILAILGIIVNLVGFLKTHNSSNIAQNTVSLHLLEDLLGWILVIITSLLIKFFGLYILDPILSLILALFIIINVIKNVKKVLDVILEKMPNNINIKNIKKEILNFDEVEDIHHIHVWSLDGNYNCLTAHIKIDKSIDMKRLDELKCEIKHLLEHKNINHSTLELESNVCSCKACKIKIDGDIHKHHHH